MSTITNKLHVTLLHSERPKLYTILAFLSAIGLRLLRILFDNLLNVALCKGKNLLPVEQILSFKKGFHFEQTSSRQKGYFVTGMFQDILLAFIHIYNKTGACFTKHLKPKIFVNSIQFVWNFKMKILEA